MFKVINVTSSTSCCSTSTHENSCSSNDSEAHNCCTPQAKGKIACPQCQKSAKGVLAKTLEHLLTQNAKSILPSLEGFHYCKTPSCDVVYFKDNTILTQDALSVVVGHKEGADPDTVCYCFHWTQSKIRKQLQDLGQTDSIEDIQTKMEDFGCSCEILNPSGSCCLGDVNKVIKSIKEELKH